MAKIFLTSTKIFEQSKIKTNFQAEQRIQILEKSVSEAQFSESQVSELQQWIFRVDDLLNDYIEHDTTFECLPHDFQVIFYLNVLIISGHNKILLTTQTWHTNRFS